MSSHSVLVNGILTEADGLEWDRRVEMFDDATINQLSCYARLEEESVPGTRSAFFQGGPPDAPTARLVAFRQPILRPVDALRRIPDAGFRALARLLPIIRWRNGPLVADDADKRSTYDAMIEAVLEWADDIGAVRVENVSLGSHASTATADAFHDVMTEHGFESQESATVILRLDGKSEEECWKGLKKDARNQVRKGERQGIRIDEAVSEEDIDNVYRLRRETALRNGFSPPPKAYFHAVRRLIPRKYFRFFLSRLDDRPLSAQAVSIVSAHAVLSGVSVSEYARANRLYANDLMQWTVIKHALAAGARDIDWVGYIRNPSDAHEKGMNRFKLKWGGEPVVYRTYGRILRPGRQAVIEKLRGILRR